ncbi:MAG: SRPBCC family protein [Gemmatimonadaceae bacterium]|nr:SRPBCC family protein [Gemmatimonadaceae bacterium]
MSASTDQLQKEIVLDSPRSRVWRAITDVREFNEWFGVNLTTPFTPGAEVSGNITIPGYDHLVATIWIENMEPQSRFSFRWHPDATDPCVDYTKEATTLVTFTFEDVDGGTKLTIVESGFDALPESRRGKAFTGNDAGWASQTKRIAAYLAAHP